MHRHYCEFLVAKGDDDVPAEHEWEHELDEELPEEPCCFSEKYRAPSCKQCPDHDAFPEHEGGACSTQLLEESWVG